jgi:hypothetical protein
VHRRNSYTSTSSVSGMETFLTFFMNDLTFLQVIFIRREVSNNKDSNRYRGMQTSAILHWEIGKWGVLCNDV